MIYNKLNTFNNLLLLRNNFLPLSFDFNKLFKWRGYLKDISYSSYIRNEILSINTGFKEDKCAPLIDFSKWSRTSNYNFRISRFLKYQIIFSKNALILKFNPLNSFFINENSSRTNLFKFYLNKFGFFKFLNLFKEDGKILFFRNLFNYYNKFYFLNVFDNLIFKISVNYYKIIEFNRYFLFSLKLVKILKNNFFLKKNYFLKQKIFEDKHIMINFSKYIKIWITSYFGIKKEFFFENNFFKKKFFFNSKIRSNPNFYIFTKINHNMFIFKNFLFYINLTSLIYVESFKNFLFFEQFEFLINKLIYNIFFLIFFNFLKFYSLNEFNNLIFVKKLIKIKSYYIYKKFYFNLSKKYSYIILKDILLNFFTNEIFFIIKDIFLKFFIKNYLNVNYYFDKILSYSLKFKNYDSSYFIINDRDNSLFLDNCNKNVLSNIFKEFSTKYKKIYRKNKKFLKRFSILNLAVKKKKIKFFYFWRLNFFNFFNFSKFEFNFHSNMKYFFCFFIYLKKFFYYYNFVLNFFKYSFIFKNNNANKKIFYLKNTKLYFFSLFKKIQIILFSFRNFFSNAFLNFWSNCKNFEFFLKRKQFNNQLLCNNIKKIYNLVKLDRNDVSLIDISNNFLLDSKYKYCEFFNLDILNNNFYKNKFIGINKLKLNKNFIINRSYLNNKNKFFKKLINELISNSSKKKSFLNFLKINLLYFFFKIFKYRFFFFFLKYLNILKKKYSKLIFKKFKKDFFLNTLKYLRKNNIKLYYFFRYFKSYYFTVLLNSNKINFLIKKNYFIKPFYKVKNKKINKINKYNKLKIFYVKIFLKKIFMYYKKNRSFLRNREVVFNSELLYNLRFNLRKNFRKNFRKTKMFLNIRFKKEYFFLKSKKFFNLKKNFRKIFLRKKFFKVKHFYLNNWISKKFFFRKKLFTYNVFKKYKKYQKYLNIVFSRLIKKIIYKNYLNKLNFYLNKNSVKKYNLKFKFDKLKKSLLLKKKKKNLKIKKYYFKFIYKRIKYTFKRLFRILLISFSKNKFILKKIKINFKKNKIYKKNKNKFYFALILKGFLFFKRLLILKPLLFLNNKFFLKKEKLMIKSILLKNKFINIYLLVNLFKIKNLNFLMNEFLIFKKLSKIIFFKNQKFKFIYLILKNIFKQSNYLFNYLKNTFKCSKNNDYFLTLFLLKNLIYFSKKLNINKLNINKSNINKFNIIYLNINKSNINNLFKYNFLKFNLYLNKEKILNEFCLKNEFNYYFCYLNSIYESNENFFINKKMLKTKKNKNFIWRFFLVRSSLNNSNNLNTKFLLNRKKNIFIKNLKDKILFKSKLNINSFRKINKKNII